MITKIKYDDFHIDRYDQMWFNIWSSMIHFVIIVIFIVTIVIDLNIIFFIHMIIWNDFSPNVHQDHNDYHHDHDDFDDYIGLADPVTVMIVLKTCHIVTSLHSKPPPTYPATLCDVWQVRCVSACGEATEPEIVVTALPHYYLKS